MTGSGASSTAIRFMTASGVVAGAQISKILFTNCVEAIGDETHATNYIVDVKLYDLRCLVTRGRQIYIKRSRGFIWVDTVRIDQTAGSGQTVTPVTWSSARFEDFIGLEINRLEFGASKLPGRGQVLPRCGSIASWSIAPLEVELIFRPSTS